MRNSPILLLAIGFSAIGCGRVTPDALATEGENSLPPSSIPDAAPTEHETSGDTATASDDSVDAVASEPTDIEVSSAGDDTHGDGTHEHPFKTIRRAVSAAAA